jgi:hypothetical protein
MFSTKFCSYKVNFGGIRQLCIFFCPIYSLLDKIVNFPVPVTPSGNLEVCIFDIFKMSMV